MRIEQASLPLSSYLEGSAPCPEGDYLKAFQKIIIKESKTSRNNDVRQSYAYQEPTKDNPTPNVSAKPFKLNAPADTRFYQDLLKQVIDKKNETQ